VFKTPGGHRRIRREDLVHFLRENNIPLHGDLKEEGTKVLVVDDGASSASLIRRFLERTSSPFTVEVAEDAFEAGRQMAIQQPDVLILDVDLPGLDAFSLCRKLRERPEYAGLQTVLLSQDGRHPEAESVCDVVLRKPFTPDDLRRAFAQLGVEAI
jgi:CheY-like chemotaxis protein